MTASEKKRLLIVALLVVLLALVAMPTLAAPAGGFTSTNTAVDGTGHCKNGNEDVNCNIYDGKAYVWMNGGPLVAELSDGNYFFAVLEPGGQAEPNDGTAKNLSDDFDAYTNRAFSVAGGVVSYSGSHDFNGNKIRLMPYADTPNSGGVYTMAICSLEDGYPVDADNCKYDAFKIQEDEVEPGLPLTVVKDADGDYTKTYTWTLDKSADETEIKTSDTSVTVHYTIDVTKSEPVISGVTVTGTITVFNPNVDGNAQAVPVDISGVTDQLSDGTVCAVTGGGPQTLTAVETPFSYTCELDALPDGPLNNTAAVSWPQQLLENGTLLAAGSANFIFESINFEPPTVVGDSITVDDTNGGSWDFTASGSASYDQEYDVVAGTCQTLDNTATIRGTEISDTESVKVCVGADLVVTKTAEPAYDLTYAWTIDKSVDKTRVQQSGGSATFNYTVEVSHDSGVESNWTVAGVITVSNPNDWQSVTVDITDAIPSATQCEVTDGADVVVPAGGSVDRSYTCTFASNPDLGTNTATASWDKDAAYTPNGSDDGTADFDFGAPTNLIDECVDVTDSYAGALGAVCVGDANPTSFTYSRMIRVPTWDCQSYDNTATFTTNDTGATGSDSQSVEVCGPIQTGALTMGFWQNKNGQAIIKTGSATAGVCNSATWLRAYNPFKDLSATATCTQVASYVTNVIKAANASGASMNKMLKGQMLATALDVYFSDPALGGNKINAPAPIGGVSIDLTLICTDMTCTTFQDSSSVFGGTPKTVLEMLSYASMQSNSGGSTWYGNVKATQELAKDAFDAINNEKVFAP